MLGMQMKIITKAVKNRPFHNALSPCIPPTSIPHMKLMYIHIVNVKNIRGDEVSGFTKLPDEYENIGVGLYYNKDLECVFAPDVLNNRIQVFYCYDKESSLHHFLQSLISKVF